MLGDSGLGCGQGNHSMGLGTWHWTLANWTLGTRHWLSVSKDWALGTEHWALDYSLVPHRWPMDLSHHALLEPM